ncbi:MAG: Verru_Chthon cassette protein A [Verrucomicrobiales bacterium]|nr:Verru_Chthon cassette protein A [Verrucomicrobiales bacterium]
MTTNRHQGAKGPRREGFFTKRAWSYWRKVSFNQQPLLQFLHALLVKNSLSLCVNEAKNRSGVALVTVLCVTVLIVGLVVAFLSMVRTELSSSAIFLANAETRQLADNAVNLVETQINHATTRGNEVAWVSQPGMIRTYSRSGAFDTAYKLYSAATLTVTDPSAIAAEDEPPPDWADARAVWTDLNSPVTVVRGAATTTTFPIFDPSAALDENPAKRIAGIAIADAPGATVSQPAPMPVRWLYILQGGQIVAPAVSGTTITISGANQANPVIGRIAFWTDDDTCKINLNTAGAGSYWDTPHFDTPEERNFATRQPLNGEFQRYPGHPAMTDLKTVFPDLTDEQILAELTPRYQWGGSEQGAKETYKMTAALANGQVANKPLLASIDECSFISDQTERMTASGMDRDRLQKLKFFLTTTSRAPELNLFNLPRIACWPLAVNPAGRTPFDQTIAFCSTVSARPYYFQRQNNLSPTEDATIERNMEIYSYLRDLAARDIPGFGVSLSAKFQDDTEQILLEIWDYIRSTNLYDSRLAPGHSFTTDNFDIAGYGYVVPLEISGRRGFGRAVTLSELAFHFICTADSVDPAEVPNADGLKGSNKFDPAAPTAGNRTLEQKLDPARMERRVQMAIHFEMFSPSVGYVPIQPKNFRVNISGLASLTLDGQPLFAQDLASLTALDNTGFNRGGIHFRSNGGPFDYRAFMGQEYYPRRSPLAWDGDDNRRPTSVYPFISLPVTVSATTAATMAFGAGPLTVTFESSADGSAWQTLQTIHITPPAASALPIPNLVVTDDSGAGANKASHWWAFSQRSPMPGDASGGRLYGVTTSPNSWGISPAGLVALVKNEDVLSGSLIRGGGGNNPDYTDVVRSMVPSHGDYRLVAALKEVPAQVFTPLGDWNAGGAANALMHTLSSGAQAADHVAGGGKWRRHFVTTGAIGYVYGGIDRFRPDFRNDNAAIVATVTQNGDFDNPMSDLPDGPFINKPDEGDIHVWSGADSADIPYYSVDRKNEVNSESFFSPNRIIAGPGMFGSLPTHVQRYQSGIANPADHAWRTLLFRKQPDHPDTNSALAPDHLLMDLFWMPTVQPYAISEPFATAGKINMNYAIEPFAYLTRKTGLLALLNTEKIAAVPTNAGSIYKCQTTVSASYRLAIDAEETLTQFDTRFAAAENTGRLFLSPTELCDLWLVPQGQSVDTMPAFWANHRLTGDNMRERPYTTMIPRLTTKSNTYTVHFRVQRLKAAPAPAGQWDENRATITAEYRGSTTIERFIDPNATAIPDYAADPLAMPALDTFYRWRIVENRQFSP